MDQEAAHASGAAAALHLLVPVILRFGLIELVAQAVQKGPPIRQVPQVRRRKRDQSDTKTVKGANHGMRSTATTKRFMVKSPQLQQRNSTTQQRNSN